MGQCSAVASLSDMQQRQTNMFAGVDEAGRGPLAGPVVAGACIIPAHVDIPGIRDSKLMTAVQRERVYALLLEHPEVVCAT